MSGILTLFIPPAVFIFYPCDDNGYWFEVIHTHSLDQLSLTNAWLTIGIFDGVHRGHREILGELVKGAHAVGAPAVVMTFEPHPAVVLGGLSEFKYLTIPTERLALLESLGVDVVITQKFNREFANLTAGEFMRCLVQATGLCHLLIGYDTALGRGREGKAPLLAEIGQELGYTVRTIPPLMDEKGIISSTRIRQDISDGQVSAAAEDLGRFYDLTGCVVHGDGRGHEINIPTANIRIPSGKLIPSNGIYASWVWLAGSKPDLFDRYPAATNIGIRPTFKSECPDPTIEAHLLDFDQDLYGQTIRLEFVEYLRPEEKYTSIEALVKQIHADIELTRGILE